MRLLVLASAFVFIGTSIPASAEDSDVLIVKAVEKSLAALVALNAANTSSAVEVDLRGANLSKGTGGYAPSPSLLPVNNGTGGYEPYPVYSTPAT